MYEVYEEGDAILPSMSLPNPCNIRIEIKDDSVALFVGRRDWCWSRKTGEMIGAGFELEHPIPIRDDNSNQSPEGELPK